MTLATKFQVVLSFVVGAIGAVIIVPIIWTLFNVPRSGIDYIVITFLFYAFLKDYLEADKK